MESLVNYILCITAAAIILGVLKSLLDPKSGSGILLRLAGGIFLAFTVISPVVDIELDALFDLPLSISEEGSSIAAQGRDVADAQLKDIIKEQCEAYILDKASSFQSVLDVEVTLSDEEVPIPTSVQVYGAISPYAKAAMGQWLEETMGITKENQQWVG